jgi:arylsulfatase
MVARIIVVLGLVFLAACGGEQPSRPHLILITADTLRADHLSVNGYVRETSPALDAFAARSWHFADAVTVIPKTAPAFATLFTGRHPEEHAVRSNFGAIPPDVPLLAERLKELGYRTAAFIGNPVLRENVGFARGFDSYFLTDGRRGEGTLSVNEAFLDWAQDPWDRPTFVWIHYMDPHGPYTPPAELEQLFIDDEWAGSDERVPLKPDNPPAKNPNKILGAIPPYQNVDGEDRLAVYVARYDAEIRYMDAAFAEAIHFLEGRGLFDESAIVFSSDHGEAFGEHDYYFEHGWFAHEPGLRVPLMLKAPGQSEGGVVGEQVSLLDIRPTLMSLAGAPEGATSGVDLLSGALARGPLLIQNGNNFPIKDFGVRSPPWKYLRRVGDGTEQLFHLVDDPGEEHDLSAEAGEQLARLSRALETELRRAQDAAVDPATGLPDDPETLERLKSLGYVGD